MSPRSDLYMSLCLEEAAKSPLHYRHGSIIVNGGKVIGKGYNSYRPGFDGGALKTGQLASGPFDANTITALKLKKKQKDGPARDQQQPEKLQFAPFEAGMKNASGGRGGHHANTPLSMHSEMMAIYSALSQSNTTSSHGSARSASYDYKASNLTSTPSAASRPTSRRVSSLSEARRLSRLPDAGPSHAFNGLDLKVLHINSTVRHGVGHNNGKSNGNEGYNEEEGNEKKESLNGSDKNDVLPLAGASAEFYRAHAHGPTHHHHQAHEDVHHHNSTYRFLRQQHRQQPESHDRSGNNHVTSKTLASTYKGSPFLLIPRTRAHTKARSVAERMKDHRLRGADLYVARLGWKKQHSDQMQPKLAPVHSPGSDPDTATRSDVVERVLTGSLHDELLQPASPSLPAPKLPVPVDPMSACLSRPCYRCISYMDTVGIKRVFWTNGEGGWDGGKVRDLVDGLEASGSLEGCGQLAGDEGVSGGVAGNGVFVTKHEVLMLRRLMGT